MVQLGIDFGKDVNQRLYTVEENQLINNLILKYKEKKQNLNDDIIISQLFFEDYCIEIINELKADKYFDDNWSLTESNMGFKFYNFIKSKTKFDESCIIEFILILIEIEELNISSSDWRDNNEVKKLNFDRKITEGFIKLIIEDKLEKIILPYMGYVKLWNYVRIYKNPFNNFKAILIHRILAEALWPKKNITYDIYADFEKMAKNFATIQCNNIYLPFFDVESRSYYSQQYLTEREKLKSNINKLFDFDNTDEKESYAVLIDSLTNNSSEEIKNRQKELIDSKIEKLMYPSRKDIDLFCKLYEDSNYKEYGKWLLSKFYCYDKIIY